MHISQVKLIITDMDGTLLNSNHAVSNRFFELYKELQRHNIIFVAASGRPYYSLIEKLAPIKDDIIFIAENGGLAIEKDHILLSTPINAKDLHTLTTLINTLEDTHPVYCSKNKAYVKSKSAALMGLLSEYYKNYVVIADESEIKEDVYKIALYHEENSEQYIYPHVKHLEKKFKVKVSANHWVDISENLANKGHALQLLQEKYGISSAETMAFGDYNNDIEMLEGSYFSYAMGNAHPNVKAIARFETITNDENGVECVLEQLLLAKRALVLKQ
ncbi:HAD family hydrolase [Bizionia saleffrena]|uniref:HAD family hydrolase n=1 Tax=Bizionia saleffrena TaxID=291189 RepID=A0A8H2LCN3_9FLAO|nr:Cof-type HAD-IIB family hydrolase [Bizionia saleffrena]TYB69426.1 HAD family hydrolase [Bizionia saleffrena]